MQLTCPCCHARFSIEAALNDEAARKSIAQALKLPAPLGDLILRYIALFRAPNRALAWDRAARLLTELLEPIQAGRIERHGRAWSAPLDTWRGALEEMLERRDKLQLPLKGHGYLLEILAARASRAEGKEEAATEQARRHRTQAAVQATTAQPIAKLAGVALERHLDALRAAKKS